MSKSVSQFRFEQQYRIRIYTVAAFVILSALFLVSRTFSLQVLHGYENNVLAKKFVNRQEFTLAPRGNIYDRNFPDKSNVIVKNLNYVDYVVYPSRFRNHEEGVKFVKLFSRVMGIPEDRYDGEISLKSWTQTARKNEYIKLLERLSRREQERIVESRYLLEKGDFVSNHLRYYTMGPVLAHVSGYIGLPSRRELDQKLALPYQMIGKGGVEARYDAEVRGTDGIRIRHRVLDSEELITESEQGNSLILTIDRDAQAAAYRSLIRSGLRGAVIAMRPTTGEILSLVSHPSFDPNILSSGTPEQRNLHYEEVTDHKGFLNLAIQAKFPPASTFKPLVAVSALETIESGVNEATSFYCPGFFKLKSSMGGVPDSVYECWQPRGHGHNDLIGAIAHSCNVYFYQLGYKLGPSPIIHYARSFGMDRQTGIDLPGETEGFVPDQRWKRLTWSSRWYDGDTVNLAIGQGFLETTPIELAVMYSGIVTRGKFYRPHVLKEIRSPATNRILRRVNPDLIREIPISKKSHETVLAGMRAVVERGTAGFLNQRIYPPIAGKTGTAQTRSGVKGSNHAWFAGVAPYGAPPEEQTVVVVFLEYGMGGAATAAPVAAEVFRTLYPDYNAKQEQKRLQVLKASIPPVAPESVPERKTP